jgi:hypothetical protein
MHGFRNFQVFWAKGKETKRIKSYIYLDFHQSLQPNTGYVAIYGTADLYQIPL